MENWELYECAIDDHRAFVKVNVDLLAQAPDAARTFTIRVVVPLLRPRADGLPDTPERPRLDTIEEILVRSMGAIGAIHVGRASFGGAVRHYFYAPGPESLDDAADRCRAAIDDRELEIGGYDDPEWQQYLEFLYPNPLGWQWIGDRRLLDALSDAGDDLERPRAIDHRADFETVAGREAFAAAVSALGYRILDRDDHHVLATPSRAHAIHFEQVLAPIAIFPATIELFGLAEAHGGDYGGWGCEVATP